MAHITSTASGNWSAGGTWTGGVAPGDGDTAKVQSGHAVTVDVNTTVGASPPAAPANDSTGRPTFSATTGGSLVNNGHYYLILSAVSAGGGESALSGAGGNFVDGATGASGTRLAVTMPSSLPSGAASFNLYSTVNNGNQFFLQATGLAANATFNLDSISTATLFSQVFDLLVDGSSAAASVTVNPGVTLRVKGNAAIKGNTGSTGASTPQGLLQVGTNGGGATLNIDGGYSCSVGTGNDQTGAQFVTRGTGASPSLVQTTGGTSGNAVLAAGGNDTGRYDLQHTTFKNLGSSSADSIVTAFSSAYTLTNVAVSHCTFDTCGRFRFSNSVANTVSFSFDNFQWKNTPSGIEPLRLQAAADPLNGVTRSLSLGYFDQTPTITTYKLSVTDVTFALGYLLADTATSWTAWQRNVVRQAPASFVTGCNTYGDVTDGYWLADNNAGNPHILLPAINQTVHGVIFEYTGAQVQDGGDGIYFASSLTLTAEFCICLPTPAGELSCNLVNCAAGASVTSQHNTYFAGYEGGHAIGDSPEGANQYVVLRNNLGWVTNGYSGGPLGPYHAYSVPHSGNPGLDTQNVVTPSGCDYNAGWNLQTGYSRSTQFPGVSGKGYNTNTSAAIGTHDVDLGTGGTGPNFVDSTRNFGAWAVHKGVALVGDTYATKVAAALTLLASDPTQISSAGSDALIPWVRGGFAPRNAALHNTASDGTDIGAVAFQAAGGQWPWFTENELSGSLQTLGF